MKLRQISIAAVAFAVLGAGYVAFFNTPSAPQLRLVTIKGEQVSSADLRGKVVLVNFWATSCVSCVKEMPRLVETHRKYNAQGFETVAVAMSYDPPNHVATYAERNALPFKVALDVNGDIARSFGDIRLTPTTFVIDKRGRIVKQYLGEPDFAQLHALLEAKLKEPA
jgi:peroxiredoxin